MYQMPAPARALTMARRRMDLGNERMIRKRLKVGPKPDARGTQARAQAGATLAVHHSMEQRHTRGSGSALKDAVRQGAQARPAVRAADHSPSQKRDRAQGMTPMKARISSPLASPA